MDLVKIAGFYNDVSKIPTTIMGENGVEAEFGIRSFHPNIAQFYIAPILSEQTTMEVDVTVSEDLLICGYVIDIKSSKALLLGPVMEHPCTKKIAFHILKRMKASVKRADEMVHYFEKIPTMALTTFTKNLFFLNYIINDRAPQIEDWNEKLVKKLGREQAIGEKQENVVHNTREWDRKLEACIEYGKVDELIEFMSSIRGEGKMGLTANDSIRSFKNVAISSIAIISRAAARGGMEYEAALSLSDEFIRQVETLSTFDEINHLLGKAFFDYASIVAKVRALNSDSKIVHEISNYVQKHISEPIQVSEIAEALGNNVSYLCRSFKKETGKTLKEYINETKLEEAEYLLLSTSKPIVDIAMALGYSSQAYFTTMFHKYTGSTPMEFREKTLNFRSK